MSKRAAAVLVHLRDLAKTASDKRPLLHIEELAIPVGACILLSGRNGAGKTTLLKIIAGLEPPDHAIVNYGNVTLPWREARRHYGGDVIYLHQQPYLFDCSVASNVAYGLRGTGLSRVEIARRVEQALATAQLGHLATRNARELSGGERQRVALTRALVLAPKLLLLDEPLANLDEQARDRACALIGELKEQRIAVVLTSHERLSLTALADYHYDLTDGRIALLHATECEPNLAARGAVVALGDASARRARATRGQGNTVHDGN